MTNFLVDLMTRRRQRRSRAMEYAKFIHPATQAKLQADRWAHWSEEEAAMTPIVAVVPKAAG